MFVQKNMPEILVRNSKYKKSEIGTHFMNETFFVR